MERLLDAAEADAFVALDADGRVASWSAGAARLFGRTAPGVYGVPIQDLIGSLAGRALLAAAEKEGHARTEHPVAREGAQPAWAETRATALRDAHGKLEGFALVTREATPRRTADELLLQSEERFRIMVESVRDYAIFMLDAGGHVQSWNLGAKRIKGYETSEILGSHLSRFYTEEDRRAGRPQRLLKQAELEGRVEDEGWRVRKDGSRFWADVVITALRNARGELIGFTKVTRDLTDRRATEESLRQSEERFRLLVDGVKDYAIFLLSPEGIVTTWNAGAERIKGFTASEALGKHFSSFYTPEDQASGKPAQELEQAAREGRLEVEGWRIRKDGTRFLASVLITALRGPGGELLGFAKVTRDMTEKRRAEEERLRLAQANEAIRLRDDFLSIASHELKTPLTALQLQLEGLRARMDALEPKMASKIDRATRSTLRLADLVENLLDVSRIATGRFTLAPEPFDASALAADVLERVGETAAKARCPLTLEADTSLEVSWDKLRIEQVLMNLLSNAFKYAAGTPVRVSVHRLGSQVKLTVADEGPGVPEEAMERIFGRFERAASMRHFGGLGLGLYVSREIVEAHGGSIAVENGQPHGARFVITLPVTAVPGRAEMVQ